VQAVNSGRLRDVTMPEWGRSDRNDDAASTPGSTSFIAYAEQLFTVCLYATLMNGLTLDACAPNLGIGEVRLRITGERFTNRQYFMACVGSPALMHALSLDKTIKIF
jgi:hypothetical protein